MCLKRERERKKRERERESYIHVSALMVKNIVKTRNTLKQDAIDQEQNKIRKLKC